MAVVEKMVPVKRLVWALAAAGVLGLGGGVVGALALTKGESAPPVVATLSTQTAPAAATPPQAAQPLPAGVAPDFAQITARNGPAVVNISVSGSVKTGRRAPQAMPEMDPNDPFYQFFRRFQIPGQPGGERSMPVRGQGSGFIVSEDGVILTNAHVIKDAQEVTVKLTDRREFPAKVLGSDPRTDVAVLKIEARNLPTLKLGNSQELRVGEWVLAIGSPFGFENSVSAGVVSAKGRALPDDSFVPFIQTDVAVNPGNSGGPLFNARGEVVGINSQIYSQSGGYQGISFAIPIEVAQRVQQQIQKGGRAQHARLGVVIQDVNQAFADSFKLERPAGALVSSVEPGGPADKAGLKPGDVILKFNDQPIIASSDLPARLGQATPGELASLEVWRQGRRESLNATLGDASEQRQAQAEVEAQAPTGKLGLALRPLQPGERGKQREGLLVEEVSGAAQRAGVQPGDVLLAVNGNKVASVEQVREAVAAAEKSVALLVLRGGQQIFVPVRIG